MSDIVKNAYSFICKLEEHLLGGLKPWEEKSGSLRAPVLFYSAMCQHR